MHRFKVGDKVKIKQSEYESHLCRSSWAIENYNEVMTIRLIYCNGNDSHPSFYVEENLFSWYSDWLEPADKFYNYNLRNKPND